MNINFGSWLTQSPSTHVVNLSRERQTGEKMDSGENDAEAQTVLEDGDDAQQNDKGQHGKSGVGVRIDVRMPRLVDFQHAQHRYRVHERRV